MTYSCATAYIHSLRSVGMQMGLERIRNACEALSQPQATYPAVHIAGTNGKGSTAAMIAAALTASGYRVGLFTSPVLTTERDVIQINGNPVSEERFVSCVKRVKAAVPSGLSEYEFLCAVVFCCFEEEHIDIAVIECCLGGETDVTNIIPPPLCAVFTPIAKDHTVILGDTIREIAKQKSGIAKAPADIVCAPHMNEDALAVLFEKAAMNGQCVHLANTPPDVVCRLDGTSFVYRDQPITLSLIGKHQADNAATALTVCERLSQKGFSISLPNTAKALQQVTMPCRLEYIPSVRPILFDGAHNPHGIDALCEVIDTLVGSPVTLVLGILADKDIESCIQKLAPRCARLYCCTPPGNTRALPAAELAAIAKQRGCQTQTIDDPIDAFCAAMNETDTPLVVGGSFYTAAPVREYWMHNRCMA